MSFVWTAGIADFDSFAEVAQSCHFVVLRGWGEALRHVLPFRGQAVLMGACQAVFEC